jgi:tetrahydromethanopterin S-methyltransferase subunit G
MKLTEKSEITFDLKFILLIAGGLLSLSATFFTLKADIEEAKKLPKMPISEKEFELKDELIRSTIMSNADRLEKIENKLDKIDTRLYNLNQ